jgi:tRNA A-37 threonylcarbamoyl transferase component Bud32
MLQGCAWDWQSPMHCMLIGQLQAVVGEIHAAGVVHGDLEPQNIKVTPNNTVYILDFEKASLPSPSSQYTDELHYEQSRSAYITSVVSKKVR